MSGLSAWIQSISRPRVAESGRIQIKAAALKRSPQQPVQTTPAKPLRQLHKPHQANSIFFDYERDIPISKRMNKRSNSSCAIS